MKFIQMMMLAAFVAVAVGGCDDAGADKTTAEMSETELREKAQRLAEQFIIVDGHIDLPYRLTERMEDVSQRTETGDFDYPRAQEGGINAPFMSIYVSARYQTSGGAKAAADRLIDMVEEIAAEHPDKFAPATSVAEVREQFAEGKISLPMGMENGAPIEGDLENLRHFYRRGIRYITLAHSKSNHISDSSYDPERQWEGLSPFGETVVAEMNRLGIMVDVSHVTDSAFYDVMRLSNAPVIASHSSCRHFTPDWERNMGDEQIRRLAENGGVICINFGSDFLDSAYNDSWEKGQKAIKDYLREHNIPEDSEEAQLHYHQYRKANPVGTVADVAKHIDHVVSLVGVEHVGLGSDFDGVLNLPKGLQDVSGYPNLIYELLKRGYSEEDIRKICGENVLRVWSEVERIAAGMLSE